MSRHHRNLPVRALSACGIPVMLAFAGIGLKSAGVQPSEVASEEVFVDQVDGLRSRLSMYPVYKGSTSYLESVNGNNAISGLCVSPDGDHLWVARNDRASIATYRFVDTGIGVEQYSGQLIAIYDEIPANRVLTEQPNEEPDSWIDLELSEDGQWLYQLFGHSGAIAIYEVDGHKLEFVELLTA